MKKGFTIIELMVTIAIISIFAVLIIVSTASVRAKNRDAVRMEDLKSISNALNLYYSTNNRFPIGNTNLIGSDSVSQDLINRGFIPAISGDPGNTNEYAYNSSADGLTYTISFCLETDSILGYSQGCGNTITP